MAANYFWARKSYGLAGNNSTGFTRAFMRGPKEVWNRANSGFLSAWLRGNMMGTVAHRMSAV
jgi:hypothetical protein